MYVSIYSLEEYFSGCKKIRQTASNTCTCSNKVRCKNRKRLFDVRHDIIRAT